MMEKLTIYSLLPRLWGNATKDLVKGGSLEENGCGKLADIDNKALAYIKNLGCNYVWYIGLLEHSTTTAFEGIPADPQSIVKGKAGSPYSVKDYYDIAPALATDVAKRQKEFEDLVKRTHQAGLGFMMDFIPNHLARSYQSDAKPKGVEDFGSRDCLDRHFAPNNNFYYFPEEELHLPSDNTYREFPAKATGNDCFSAYPSVNDWYEAIKLNYGVDYLSGGAEHFDPIPDTWSKMYAILDYWASREVDAFRCDMAELVPVPFWAWCINKLKEKYPKLVFLAEIYQRERYQAYIKAGFDYLYDKVGMYDAMRAIIRGEAPITAFDTATQEVDGFRDQMCYFLENHDEQRIASDFFAGDSESSYPALVSLALSGSNPFLLYFGQELGERGMDEEGFSGRDGRTTIFDYWALDKVQRLRAGAYTAHKLNEDETDLLLKYQNLFNLINQEEALISGAYYGLNYAQSPETIASRCISFMRYIEGTYVLIVANCSAEDQELSLNIPQELFAQLNLKENTALQATELLGQQAGYITTLTSKASYEIKLEAYGVRIIKFTKIQKK